MRDPPAVDVSWSDFLLDASSLVAIFGARDLRQDQLTLHEVVVSRDGPEVRLRFDLPEFPTDPPQKWVAQGFNTVQVTLSLVGVRNLSLEGLSTEMVVMLEISELDAGIQLNIIGDGIALTASADAAVLGRVSAYMNSTD